MIISQTTNSCEVMLRSSFLNTLWNPDGIYKILKTKNPVGEDKVTNPDAARSHDPTARNPSLSDPEIPLPPPSWNPTYPFPPRKKKSHPKKPTKQSKKIKRKRKNQLEKITIHTPQRSPRKTLSHTHSLSPLSLSL